MALESSDLNDGQILQQTRQITDERGNIQFNITLPSGRVLKSEFMRKDDARAGMRKWLDVVKEQAIADSNAERLERAAKARRGSMDIERRPGDDQPLFRAGGARVDEVKEELKQAGLVTPVISVSAGKADLDSDGLPVGYQSGPHPNAEVDPLEFARKQRQYWEDKVQGLLIAQKALRQWSVIVEALEESE